MPDEWKIPAGAWYGVSKSGWMEAEYFLDWFISVYFAAADHLVTLVVDGHHSHLSLPLVKAARGKDVHLCSLPPHSTHILQPLDVGHLWAGQWNRHGKNPQSTQNGNSCGKHEQGSFSKLVYSQCVNNNACITQNRPLQESSGRILSSQSTRGEGLELVASPPSIQMLFPKQSWPLNFQFLFLGSW